MHGAAQTHLTSSWAPMAPCAGWHPIASSIVEWRRVFGFYSLNTIVLSLKLFTFCSFLVIFMLIWKETWGWRGYFPSATTIFHGLHPKFLQPILGYFLGLYLCSAPKPAVCNLLPSGDLPCVTMFAGRRERVQRRIGKERKTRSDFKRPNA